MEVDSTPVVQVDPKGDVILELTLHGGMKRLLVSSKILSMVSPVFAAMFSSQFKEGLHNTTPGIVPTVSLPEDDAITFEIICNVVHFRHKYVSVDLPCEQLINIAVTVDKYELREAVYTYSVLWLVSAIKRCTDQPLVIWSQLLFVCYVLDTPAEFAKISWEIVLYHVGPYISLSAITDHVLISHSMLAELDTRTVKLHSALLDAINRVLLKPQQAQCDYKGRIVADYLECLSSKGLFPLTNILQEKSLIAICNKLANTEPKRFRCGQRQCAFCNDRKFTFSGFFRDWKDTVFGPQFGICLDCVKTGRESLRKKECRVEHA